MAFISLDKNRLHSSILRVIGTSKFQVKTMQAMTTSRLHINYLFFFSHGSQVLPELEIVRRRPITQQAGHPRNTTNPQIAETTPNTTVKRSP